MAREAGWTLWGSDVPISAPVAPDDDVLVDFGGFGFTGMAFVHNLTQVEKEIVFTPPYAPGGGDG